MLDLTVILYGAVVAVMVTINGTLTNAIGVFPGTLVIHIVGSTFAFLLCRAKGLGRNLWRQGPAWIYLGGAIGVISTVLQTAPYGIISVTSINALGLLGQTVTSVIFDMTGALGMKKQKVYWTNLVTFGCAGAGIWLMLDHIGLSAAGAVLMAGLSGFSVVLSRVVNAQLAEKTGALNGSLVNHLVGLMISGILAAAVIMAQGFHPAPAAANPLIYTGGIFGVICVGLLNLLVHKVASIKLTILSYVSQVFCGMALDYALGLAGSDSSFRGALVISAGMVAGMILEQFCISRGKRNKS